MYKIYRYVKHTDTWNVHRHRNPETLTTFFSSYTKLLLTSWLLGFQHEERDTQFLLCRLFHLIPPHAAHLVDPNELTSSRFKSQLTAFFQKSPQPNASGHDVIHIPSSFFLSGVFIMTSVIVTSSPREREHLRSMCAPTRALSWIVLSLTKPKDRYNQRKMII